MGRMSRVPSDASTKSIPPATESFVRKRKMTDDTTSERPENHQYSTRRRITAKFEVEETEPAPLVESFSKSDSSKRVLRSRK